jgi:hypothetical protein
VVIPLPMPLHEDAAHLGVMAAPTHQATVMVAGAALGAGHLQHLPTAATPTIIIAPHLLTRMVVNPGHGARSVSRSAMLLMSTGTCDQNWYLDSGVTDHITSELEKLTLHERYNGNNQIRAANGASMDIVHVGTSVVPSSSRTPSS